MPKVLVADEISSEGLEIMRRSVEVDYLPEVSAEELLKIINSYEAMLVRSRCKVTREVLEKADKLRIVGRAGVGVDNIDLQAATEKGVLVINSPEGNTASAAEHTLALMMALSRQIPTADASMKAGRWERNNFLGSELFNKTLGVIGLGKIGSRVSQAGQALGMKVIAYDPFMSAERARELNVRVVTLDEIWEHADYITLHIPKTRDTTGLINADVLKRMKAGARIINAARGGLIDEAALAEAIKSGKIAGAGLDVFSEEPLKESPLKELGAKVVLTPHLGASTEEAQFNVAIDIAEQISDYLAGKHVRSPVNMPSMRPEILKALGKFVWLAEAMAAVAGEFLQGNIRELDIVVSGELASKDTAPLATAALRGLFASRMEGVTYVNAPIVAKNHGVHVRQSSLGSDGDRAEISLTLKGDNGESCLTGTVLAHDEPLIIKINDFPVNLTPQRYMLFTSHRDQPGMVAKVAGILGQFDINISTMSVARLGVREEAVMVMGLDDPLNKRLLSEVESAAGIHLARFVSLDHLPQETVKLR
ncbi:MAG: phosphoglycerate dehydrogenase [Candidatus Obscuribacterales bacterium]|nr:phosphoglycerate dehydrogenase [Candidatus Obscuribacterales bacterium]